MFAPVVYSGLGFLVPFMVIGSYIGTAMAVDGLFGRKFVEENAWTNALPLIGTGVVLLVFGSLINRLLVRKPQGDQNPEVRYSHTFFVFPIEYWSIFPFGLAIAAFVKGCAGS
jgi:hypothetical protein